ncbi:hypothetical protein [uncultured Desulfobulbus sp.]|uniref:hypothetical protein n=1 Tax=uncultured Desulfobulbus sp. TaxID=239745 RepID=UPI0029C8972E|nr:hypothetical protein [uncultured Desulfobulbus sp.]
MRTAGLLAFLPQEFLPLMMVCGGLLVILGQKKLAGMLFTLCGVMIVAPIVLDPLLAQLPEWVLYLLIAYLVMDVLAIFLVLLVGERAWDEAKGHLVARSIIFLIFAPFKLIGFLMFGRRR